MSMSRVTTTVLLPPKYRQLGNGHHYTFEAWDIVARELIVMEALAEDGQDHFRVQSVHDLVVLLRDEWSRNERLLLPPRERDV